MLSEIWCWIFWTALMTLDELRQDLSERMGRRVIEVFTRDGEPVQTMGDLYQPSPAGFGGKLSVAGGSRFAWELWLEDGDLWNFHVAALAD